MLEAPGTGCISQQEVWTTKEEVDECDVVGHGSGQCSAHDPLWLRLLGRAERIRVMQ